MTVRSRLWRNLCPTSAVSAPATHLSTPAPFKSASTVSTFPLVSPSLRLKVASKSSISSASRPTTNKTNLTTAPNSETPSSNEELNNRHPGTASSDKRTASFVASNDKIPSKLLQDDNPFRMERPINVLGRPLTQCGTNPMTGFYRDGYCNTGPADGGSHTVAAVVSEKWLDFSASKGNDLRPILSEGCSWCLCVSRWKQSLDAYKRGELPKEGVPKVKLEATHQKALDLVTLEDLKNFALQGNSSSSSSAARDPSQGGPIR